VETSFVMSLFCVCSVSFYEVSCVFLSAISLPSFPYPLPTYLPHWREGQCVHRERDVIPHWREGRTRPVPAKMWLIWRKSSELRLKACEGKGRTVRAQVYILYYIRQGTDSACTGIYIILY